MKIKQYIGIVCLMFFCLITGAAIATGFDRYNHNQELLKSRQAMRAWKDRAYAEMEYLREKMKTLLNEKRSTLRRIETLVDENSLIKNTPEKLDDYDKAELLQDRRLLNDILEKTEKELRLARSRNASLENDIKTILSRLEHFLHDYMFVVPRDKEFCKTSEEEIEVKGGWI